MKGGPAILPMLLALAAALAAPPGASGTARPPVLAAAPPAGAAASAPPITVPADSAGTAAPRSVAGRPSPSGDSLPDVLLALDTVRLAVMEPNGVFPGDLDLLPPNARPDRFRLSRVAETLRDPFRLEGVVDEVLARTASAGGASPALPVSPGSLWPLLDAEPIVWPEALPGAPGHPDSALMRIRAGLAEHLAPLSGPERDFLHREASSLFLQEEDDTTQDAIENELERLEEEARAHRLMELAGRLRRPALVRAATAAWELEVWILDSLRAGGFPASPGKALDRLLPRLRALAARADVPVKVGTPGPDRHRPDRGIWIDPGGDDTWDLVSRGVAGEFLLVIDLGGDDLYRSRDSLHRSPGNLGISLLADLAGDDRYLGENFAFGSALFGYAHLFDAAGHDAYEGRCASLGFAAFGIGVLEDMAGNDVYSASLLSQGASGTAGLGLLLDRDGNDRYLAKPTFPDDLRYNDRFLHMVQGFSTGLAPDYSGGIGVLRDQKGNDVYLADIFGQGAGYWYALGLLLDESGDDRYEAHQYAQGAGVHIAVGAAVDWAGDDHWASKGVSQGCGHDLGFGLLHDRGGDDNYLGTDKVQGSGSANGLGVLYDAAGGDVYTSLNPAMALGDADMRRDRGSFGFFLDGRGRDWYSPRPDGAARADGDAWRVFDGKVKGNGYGLDRPDTLAEPADVAPLRPPAPPPATAAAAPPMVSPSSPVAFPVPARPEGSRRGDSVFVFSPPALSAADSLFLVAATGEPRFKTARDSAERRLKEGGGATLDYLLARRLTGQTPRQRHYVERLFVLLSDSGRNRASAERLDAALRTAPDSVKVQLLRIGSALGDSAFLPAARRHLRADSAEVRKMALRSLGTYPARADLPFLLENAVATSGPERQMTLWALAQHSPLHEWKTVLPLLRDPRQYNRQLARRILAKAWGGDFAKGRPHAPVPEDASVDPLLRLEWALLAAEMPGPAAQAWLRRALPILDPAGRAFFRGSLPRPPARPAP